MSQDRIIHLTQWVGAAPATTFAHFTRAELLETWLTRAAEIEPRVGGKYELFWAPPDRAHDSTLGCTITALASDQLLAFQWRSPRQFSAFANAADPLTHVTVAFIPEEAGTRIHLVHSGWRSAAEWEEARLWQERAWSGALAALERVAAGNRGPGGGIAESVPLDDRDPSR